MRFLVLALCVSSVTLLTQTAPAQRLQEDAPPAVPSQASPANVKGVVILKATISSEGRVTDVQRISGPPQLIKAAENAVLRWRYKPILKNGVPTGFTTNITVNFTYDSNAKTAVPGAKSPMASEPQSASAPN